jgi:hypothetical protein
VWLVWFFSGKWMVKRGEKTVRSCGGTPVPVGDFSFLPQKSQMVADVVVFERVLCQVLASRGKAWAIQ